MPCSPLLYVRILQNTKKKFQNWKLRNIFGQSWSVDPNLTKNVKSIYVNNLRSLRTPCVGFSLYTSRRESRFCCRIFSILLANYYWSRGNKWKSIGTKKNGGQSRRITEWIFDFGDGRFVSAAGTRRALCRCSVYSCVRRGRVLFRNEYSTEKLSLAYDVSRTRGIYTTETVRSYCGALRPSSANPSRTATPATARTVRGPLLPPIAPPPQHSPTAPPSNQSSRPRARSEPSSIDDVTSRQLYKTMMLVSSESPISPGRARA